MGEINICRSTGYGDELTWAAIWLYKKTKDVKYIEQAETFYTKFRIKDRPTEFFYNKKVAGIQVKFKIWRQIFNFKFSVVIG